MRTFPAVLMMFVFISAPLRFAYSQTPPEKICVLKASSSLPKIPGLQIKQVTTNPESGIIVAAYLFAGRSFKDAESMTSPYLSPVGLDAIDATFLKGNTQKAFGQLGAALAKHFLGSIKINVDIEAAGQQVTYVFYCGWTSGNEILVSLGQL